MADCDYCGEHENLPYQCRHCGGTYCAEHRLPENHDCPGLDQWSDPQGVFDSGFDDTVRSDLEGRSQGLAGRLPIDTGPGGLFGYFRGNMSFLFLALMWATFMLQLAIGQVLNLYALHDQLFVLSSAHIERVWTWVTSIFAHGGFGHIAVNSIVLYFFGPIVERRVGSRKFTALFIAAGVVAGLAQVGTALVLGNLSAVVGASGAIMAIMGVLTVLNPHLKVYLWFILPMPLWILTIGFALISVFLVTSAGAASGGIAHLAHLAGLGIGLGYGEKIRRDGARAPQQLRFGGGGGGLGPGGPGGRRRF